MSLKFYCPQCGQVMISQSMRAGEVTVCPSCTRKIAIPSAATETDELPNYEVAPEAMASGEESVRLNQRYPALRTIAGVLRFLAWLDLLVGVIGFFVILSVKTGFGGQPNVISAFAVMFLSAISFICFLAFAELVGVMVDTEENTRATRELLAQRTGR
jgi:predicted RNA-binding Zn-ribbon protein involved in translation (DUF1610 family)